MEDLKFDPEEIKMLKKSTQAWIEYKNFENLNPETAFLATLVILSGKQTYMMRKVIKGQKELLLRCMKISNPSMVKDYKDHAESTKDVSDRAEKSKEKTE